MICAALMPCSRGLLFCDVALVTNGLIGDEDDNDVTDIGEEMAALASVLCFWILVFYSAFLYREQHNL